VAVRLPLALPSLSVGARLVLNTAEPLTEGVRFHAAVDPAEGLRQFAFARLRG